MATSISPIDTAAAYLRERYASPVFVVLAALLATTGLMISPGPVAVAALVRSFAIAYLLVLAFRIGDDLADAPRDAVVHPDRVLVRATDRRPFIALLIAAAAFAGALIATTPEPVARLIAIGCAALLLGVWYAARGDAKPLIGAHIVLLKYPIIALAAAPAFPRSVTGSAVSTLVALYAVLCAYETFDDPVLHASPAARRLALLEGVLVIPLLLLGGLLT
jgi:4-hydroxybenzoate polyprenyltransferase